MSCVYLKFGQIKYLGKRGIDQTCLKSPKLSFNAHNLLEHFIFKDLDNCSYIVVLVFMIINKLELVEKLVFVGHPDPISTFFFFILSRIIVDPSFVNQTT